MKEKENKPIITQSFIKNLKCKVIGIEIQVLHKGKVKLLSRIYKSFSGEGCLYEKFAVVFASGELTQVSSGGAGCYPNEVSDTLAYYKREIETNPTFQE